MNDALALVRELAEVYTVDTDQAQLIALVQRAQAIVAEISAEQRPLVGRVTRYLALCDEPEFVECQRCKGEGYHHGFGEDGADPDWCEECGGPGVMLHPDANVSPDDLLREMLAAFAPQDTK